MTVAALVGVLGGGCDASALLVVQVRSDFAPGWDFVAVRTEVFRGRDPRGGSVAPDRVQEIPATRGQNYFVGQAVAELGGLAPDTYFVRVSMMGPEGEGIGTRMAQVRLEAHRVVTLVIARSCAGVRCPRDGDRPEQTECSGGRCVEPSCVETSGACPAECVGEADCDLAHAECATPRCDRGACLLEPHDERCPPGFACHAVDGCQPVPDAGPAPDGGADGGPGTMDAGSSLDGGCSGECAAGETQHRSTSCGRCGSRRERRVCGSDCRWGSWTPLESCSGEGPCAPGATDSSTMRCGCTGSRSCTRTCDGSCNWGSYSCGACTGDVFCTDELDASRVCPGEAGADACATPGCYRTCTCSSSGSWTACSGMCFC